MQSIRRLFLIAITIAIGYFFTNCTTYETIDQPGVASLNTVDDERSYLEEWIQSNELMAYVMNEDENIYVDDKYVEEIQKELNAIINGGTWLYQNSEGIEVKRTQKPLNVKDYSSGVSMVKWSYAKGYNCQEKPKGYLLPIHRAGDRNKKIVAAYETTAKGNWCVDNKYGICKFGWKKVTAKFIKVRNGKLIKKKGKYVRSKKTSLSIMICVKS